MKLPTIKEVDDRELQYRQWVIDKNVYDIALAVQCSKYKEGGYRGHRDLYYANNTLSTYENVKDCILYNLNQLENSQHWEFKELGGRIYWSSNGFPEKPWWKFW